MSDETRKRVAAYLAQFPVIVEPYKVADQILALLAEPDLDVSAENFGRSRVLEAGEAPLDYGPYPITSPPERSREPDAMCHARGWRSQLKTVHGATIRPYDAERCKGDGPPYPVYVGTPPSSSAEPGGWRPIETAPESGYIIGAWKYGSRWTAGCLHTEYGEWIDVHSDRHRQPTHWMPLPPAPDTEESEEADE